MGNEMTAVYSGGLMYEYAMEENGYGIVKIPNANSDTVEQETDFAKLASALAAHPAPLGNGGAKPTTHAAPCPTKDANWLVDSTLLPAIPEGAKVVSFLFLTRAHG
jgi:1,3-beta-glucanosyltransferase GAS5